MIVVDPILGDSPKGLYVKPEVAALIQSRLVPLADWITPNAWELGELAGGPVVTARDAVEAARRIGRPALVTSIAAGPGEIGLVYVDERDAVLFAHPRIAKAPNGTGDLVTACFGAALVQGLEPLAAAQRTAQAVAQTMQTVHALGSKDLPIVAMAAHLEAPSAVVRMERL